MTCIVGYVNDECMVMGGDSAGSAGGSYSLRRDPKVFKVPQVKGQDAIIGFTSSYRMGQLLMSLKIPEDKSSFDDKGAHFEFLRTKFIEVVRKLFRDGGYSRVINNVESGGNFILGYRGRIYEVDSDFQVEDPFVSFVAIGAGEEFAVGALDYMCNHTDLTELVLEQIVLRALETSERYCNLVKGPMKLVKVINKVK